jgi:hypothetical protein
MTRTSTSAVTSPPIPIMKPDLCIVNYYTAGAGRLGVHQVSHFPTLSSHIHPHIIHASSFYRDRIPMKARQVSKPVFQ